MNDKLIMKKIAAVVVTYNRKELLAFCLEAICAQTYKPYTVYIIDNASTDGTDDWIKENHYDGLKDSIDFHYVRLQENIGGSGGFYTGMKMAHEAPDEFDAIWMMDDDGIPDKKQLYHLVSHLDQYDYLSSFVVSKEDQSMCAMENCSVQEYEKTATDGLILNAANPFNGVLYSRKLVDVIGYPVKDMFIWGDEYNYHLRCIKLGFTPAIVVAAKHVHPKDRQQRQKLFKRYYSIPEQDWKLYVYVRNITYNNRTLSRRARHYYKVSLFVALEYTYYLTLVKPSLHKLAIVYRAIYDGICKDLTRLHYYKK